MDSCLTIAKVATIDNSAVLNAQNSKDTPSLAVMVTDLTLSAVNKPTVLLPSARLDYRVKAGDIRSRRSLANAIFCSKKSSANKLASPDRQINCSLFLPFNTAVLPVNCRQ